MCFIDIACDEIPERYYKESEVRDPNRRITITDALIHSFHTVFVRRFLCLESSHLTLCFFGLVLTSHGFFKVDLVFFI